MWEPLVVIIKPLIGLVEPIDPLMIDYPAFPPNQHINSPEAEPHTGVGNLSHPSPKGLIQRLALRLPIPTRSALQTNFAGPLNAHTVTIDQVADERLGLRRPQSFFLRTSCSMTLSRLRSATSCLRLRFSSSSYRKRLSSETPNPPYFFFQE